MEVDQGVGKVHGEIPGENPMEQSHGELPGGRNAGKFQRIGARMGCVMIGCVMLMILGMKGKHNRRSLSAIMMRAIREADEGDDG